MGHHGWAGYAVSISGGAGRIKLDQGSAPAIWNVANSAQRLETGIPSVLLKGTNAANALNVNKGDVGVAFFGVVVIGAVTSRYPGVQAKDLGPRLVLPA